jgi:cytochrome P450
LNALAPLFAQSGSELRDYWFQQLESASKTSEDKKAEVTFDIYEEMSKATLDVIGQAGFGYDFNAVALGTSPLFTAFQTMMSNMTFSFLTILESMFPILRQLPTKKQREIKAAKATIDSQVQNLIQTRQSEMQKGITSQPDLLSIILKANQDPSLHPSERLTEAEVKGQVLTFLGAGHETTSVALSWALHLLANNPNIQQKLRTELQSVFPDPLSEPTADLLNGSQLPYLEMVAKETLRCVPPVPITVRVASKDDELDGYEIPKGTVIVLVPGVTHRLKEYWGEDADEFKPERWASTSEAGASPTKGDAAGDLEGGSKVFGAYMPFLLGPR